ncbi:MAG: Fe-S cluster assembly protein SufB [Proteobacteria bacterium SG_bin7]|nr:MAG: Fe-S cluster assembly protein SufB [Proteobacteria bacterium SG_bin7]
MNTDYKYGFVTSIEEDRFPKGLSEEIIRKLSAIKKEPKFLLDFRLNAFEEWKKQAEPKWAHVKYDAIDFQNLSYYAAPKQKDKSEDKSKKLEDLDPELLATFERLGIPVQEQKRISGVAMDLVFDSVSLGTTHQKELEALGVIFCSISEATQKCPDLIEKYLGSVVPTTDNFYATLNSAVFSDGSFCYIPKGVKCPIDLSTYFRINAKETGQFERTLVIADEGSFVNYLEGCTAPQRDENQLHAAVVELVALKNAEIRYSTVQNWYTGDRQGRGGVYNFVTKRGKCFENAKISWTQVESGSAITWKYPSCILHGDNSVGAFYSVALTHDKMQADTGTKMIHVGKNTKSTIVSKGISTGGSVNSYRGLVKILPTAENARNYSQCDSMLVGEKSSANTFPYIECKNSTAVVEHEASTSRVSEDQLFYLQSRGMDKEAAVSLLVNGFCKDVFKQLPLEFSVEAVKLIEMKLENSIG